ncbi:MAG: sigma-70 family RNA polymerase sigma factor [Candidatus Diapherotrites archaeon]|nr:sigma-70 family RNA polymerase sigma factor [Candidatus Diapherotrites archaeon]
MGLRKGKRPNPKSLQDRVPKARFGRKQKRLLVANQGMIALFCRRYGKDLLHTMPFQELVQEVNLKLIPRLWQYDGKHRLSTFLDFKVRGIISHLRTFRSNPKRNPKTRVLSLNSDPLGFANELIADPSLRRNFEVIATREVARRVATLGPRLVGKRDWNIFLARINGVSFAALGKRHHMTRQGAHLIYKKVLVALQEDERVQRLVNPPVKRAQA